jgi:hypothetical protein
MVQQVTRRCGWSCSNGECDITAGPHIWAAIQVNSWKIYTIFTRKVAAGRRPHYHLRIT